jgi:beta-glucosidase
VRPFLADLAKRYPTEGGIYLSEFGFSEPFENEYAYQLAAARHGVLRLSKTFIYQITQDSGRTAYFNSYLGEVLKGIVEDGIPIKGVFGWSMVDNFEWNSGLSSTSTRPWILRRPV